MTWIVLDFLWRDLFKIFLKLHLKNLCACAQMCIKWDLLGVGSPFTLSAPGIKLGSSGPPAGPFGPLSHLASGPAVVETVLLCTAQMLGYRHVPTHARLFVACHFKHGWLCSMHHASETSSSCCADWQQPFSVVSFICFLGDSHLWFPVFAN